MIYTNMPKNCMVFLLHVYRRLSIWQFLMDFLTAGKPHTCVDHCILLLNIFLSMHFYNKQLQTLFIDQLVGSNATYPFNIVLQMLT